MTLCRILLTLASLASDFNSGIGRECAILFASEGANVVLADINLEACQKTADIVNERFNNAELPVKAIAMKCDVSKEDEVAAIVKRAVDEFGRLDVMVSVSPSQTKSDSMYPDYVRSPLLFYNESVQQRRYYAPR